MDTWLFVLLGSPLMATSRLWYCLPLLISISLVYGATRHEQMVPILEHAFRFGVWVVTFMIVIFAILMLATWLV